MHRATFSARLPTCSPTAAAVQLVVDRRKLDLAPLPINRDRDRTPIASSATYLKMCVPTPLDSTRADDKLTIYTSSSGQRSSGVTLCGLGWVRHAVLVWASSLPTYLVLLWVQVREIDLVSSEMPRERVWLLCSKTSAVPRRQRCAESHGTQRDPDADMLYQQILRVLALKVLGAAYS